MKLILFADLHYYGGDRETAIFGKTKKLTQYAMPMLEQLIERVNRDYKPDAVINLGDSIQDANDRDADVLSLTTVAEKLKEFHCPCYTVLGNHDLKMFDSHREAEEIFGCERFNDSLDLCGYHLVFLTNGVKPELGTAGGGIPKTHAVSEDTIEWLREDLKRSKNPALIFTHYAFYGSDANVIKNGEQVLQVLRESGNVAAAFSGHTHRAYSEEHDGIAFHVLGSPTADLEESGRPDGVYYEVELCGGEITVTEHLFEVAL